MEYDRGDSFLFRFWTKWNTIWFKTKFEPNGIHLVQNRKEKLLAQSYSIQLERNPKSIFVGVGQTIICGHEIFIAVRETTSLRQLWFTLQACCDMQAYPKWPKILIADSVLSNINYCLLFIVDHLLSTFIVDYYCSLFIADSHCRLLYCWLLLSTLLVNLKI